MNINYIKTFIAVYRTRSFIEVAKDQSVAASSVSRSIATLESILKTRLFQRTTRSLTPTQSGEAYFEKMEPLIEELDLVNQSLKDATAKPSGRLRVSMSVSYGQIVIAPKLAAFRKQYPDIQLELILSDNQVDLVNDQIDLAIRHGNLPDSSLVTRKLTDVKYRLVSSLKYLEQHGTPKEPQDLKEHELVTFTYDDFKHNWRFDVNETTQNIPIRPVLTASNASIIRQCIRDGLGIALLADWTISDDLKSGKLEELFKEYQISGASKDTAVWLIYPSRMFKPAKTTAFIDFLLKNIN